MLAEVYIATTHGLVRIQSITSLGDLDLSSVVTVNNTSKFAGISNDYADFVSKPSGLIQSDFGDASFRLNISDNITQGQSWQLGMYIAHYLHKNGALFDNNNEGSKNNTDQSDSNIIIIATGVIDTINRTVKKVESLPRKCLTANSDIQRWLSDANQVLFLAPIDNLKEPVPDARIQLTPISQLKELELLFQTLGLIGSSNVSLSESKPWISNNPNNIERLQVKNIANRSDVVESEPLHTLPKRNYFKNRTFKKLKNKNILFIALALVCVVTLILINYPSKTASFISLVTDSGSNGQCVNTISSDKFIKITDDFNTYSQIQTFDARPAYLKNLCSIRILTSQQVASILVITDSKGLIQLSHKTVIESSDLKFIQEHLKHGIQSINKPIRWDVPLPRNKSLARFYFLVVSTSLFDAADLQSIEAELLKLYYAGSELSEQDIMRIIRGLEKNSIQAIIYHSLEKTYSQNN